MASALNVFCDKHYSFECGCRSPVAPPTTPAHVWVVVEIYSKSVRLNEGAATQPISGKAAIFAKPEITKQVAARIVGVYGTEHAARSSVPNTEGAEYLVEQRGIEWEKPVVRPQPSQNLCIICHVPSATTFCKACEAVRVAEMRARDGDIITEKVPAGA